MSLISCSGSATKSDSFMKGGCYWIEREMVKVDGKDGVLKLQKCEYSIEYFISRKVNILEYSNIVLLKSDINT